MSIFKYLTLSHLQKVLAALEVRFKGIENNVSEIENKVETELGNINIKQSDWNEKDEYDKAYILHKPPVDSGTGVYSIKEGDSSVIASGSYSHAEGQNTIASGFRSHAEGFVTTASNDNCHAEGYLTKASNDNSHAEGYKTTSSGNCSHAEGSFSKAPGSYSHAEGYGTNSSGHSSHAEGGLASDPSYIFLTGEANAVNYTVNSATINGMSLDSIKNLNLINFYIVSNEHIIVNQTTVNGVVSTITVNETLSSTAITNSRYVLFGNVASAGSAHAEGAFNHASGVTSHAEGSLTIASGEFSHSEGMNTIASGDNSHAEGQSTTASGFDSHAEGYYTTASGYYSHAEGNYSTSSGIYSHSEGSFSTASGDNSHAEGHYTTASGDNSHTEGHYTTARRRSQHVFGEYNLLDNSGTNVSNKGTYIEIVGNGTSDTKRSNARTLDWSGNEVLAGKLTVGLAPINDMDVATKKYVDDHAGGGSLLDLSDISITSPVDGQILMYNSTTSKWENTSLPIYAGDVADYWQGGSF